jgi:hypothetical protein
MKIMLALALLFVAAIPGAMAACGDTINANEGKVVTLTMTPVGSYNYLWTLPLGVNLLPGYSLNNRVIKVYAPPVTACTDYVVNGYMESTLITNIQECKDECTVTIHDCPEQCPPTDYHADTCITNYAPWTLTILPQTTWSSGTTFTWTVTETSDEVWSKTLGPYTDNDAVTLQSTDFQAVTVDHPKKCFTVSVVVKDAAGTTILTCDTVGTICLVFDPTVVISSSVA